MHRNEYAAVYARVCTAANSEDAGRLRLTFRCRARAWTVVVQRDGTLSDASWSQG